VSEVVKVSNLNGIFQESMEYIVVLVLDSAVGGIVLSAMASAASYRIYEMTIGNQVAASHTIVCDSDQNAIEMARTMLDDRDLVIRHGARLVARLRVADNNRAT
jgi:hypothetical protein